MTTLTVPSSHPSLFPNFLIYMAGVLPQGVLGNSRGLRLAFRIPFRIILFLFTFPSSRLRHINISLLEYWDDLYGILHGFQIFVLLPYMTCGFFSAFPPQPSCPISRSSHASLTVTPSQRSANQHLVDLCPNKVPFLFHQITPFPGIIILTCRVPGTVPISTLAGVSLSLVSIIVGLKSFSHLRGCVSFLQNMQVVLVSARGKSLFGGYTQIDTVLYTVGFVPFLVCRSCRYLFPTTFLHGKGGFSQESKALSKFETY